MNNILSALNSLDVSAMSYQEWISVGMALHSEGYDCSVWDAWSRNDTRYRAGECERKWLTFGNCPTPVTGGTIVRMAQERGWKGYGEDGIMSWDDIIEDDGDGYMS